MGGLEQMVGLLTTPMKRPQPVKAPGERNYNRQGRKHGSGTKDKPLLARFDAWPVGHEFKKVDLIGADKCSISHCGYVIERLKSQFAVKELPRDGVACGKGFGPKKYRKVAQRPGMGEA